MSKRIESIPDDPAAAAALPLREAADRMLDERLRRVERAVRDASDPRGADTKSVHALRVSTRRAAATITLFQPWLGRKKTRAAKRVLRTLRRRASMARAADVLLVQAAARHRDTRDPAQREGWALVIGRLAAQADRGRDELASALETLDHRAVRDARRTLIDSLHAKPDAKRWRKARTLGDLASLVEAVRAAELERALDRDLTDLENLHELRLEGKRLRYTLELTSACRPEGKDAPRIAALRAMQDHLGNTNDLSDLADAIAETRSLLATAPATLTDALDVCEQAIERQIDDARAAFAEWIAGPGPTLLRAADAPPPDANRPTAPAPAPAPGARPLELEIDDVVTAARAGLNGAHG